MLNKNDLEKIKEETSNFFRKMTFETEADVSGQEDGTVSIDIKTQEPKILIGEGGQTLAEIQHLLKIILRRKLITEPFFIDLDISDYKKKKSEYLRELAKEAADEVSLTRQEKILAPMSAYERRIVHMALVGRSDVKTESIGQEPDRRIMIKTVS
jgi:spoIIIJ-associated protein